MWMMEECTNHHGKESRVDPMFGRRLRPIIPRPISSSNGSKTATFHSSTTLTTPCLHYCENNPKNTRALPWNHHMISGVSDYAINSKVVPLVSTRWNPTPEQLMALEEMYKLGTRTPTAEQIQQIASKLRRFGKIEGKNVFYWFQNHKARERQKKRRQLELLAGKKSTDLRHVENNSSDTKRKGSCSRYNDNFELQNKNLVTRSTRNKQDNEPSMRGTVMAECINKDEWAQLDHKKLQQINNNNNATAKSENNYCLKVDLSSTSFLPASEKTFTDTTQEKLRQTNSKLFSSMFILSPKNEDSIIEVKENHDQTLQLFPVRSSDLNSVVGRNVSCVGRKLMPSRFIEFLPTKN